MKLAEIRTNGDFMNAEDALKVIESTQGKFFKVIFIKKNNRFRSMLAQTEVKTDVAFKTLQFDAEHMGMKPVWEKDQHHWKMINFKTILYFKCGEIEWKTPNKKFRELNAEEMKFEG